MRIKDNLDEIKAEINEAQKNVNRADEEVTLVAVTKTVDIDEINHVIALGVTDIGENRVQELLRKYEVIGSTVTWHMIGHLQKNKVKYIVDKVDYIHSVDSLDLAKEIEKRASKIHRPINCFIEVNVSGEATKHGIKPEELVTMIEELDKFKYVKIIGLMTMAPYVEDPEEVRQYFKTLKTLSNDVNNMELCNIKIKHLSMGMSNDFKVAIEEGATMVRIGSSIFS